MMFTVLTLACIFVFLNNCDSSTSRQRAPAHIVHLLYSVMHTLCLIFLQHCLVKAYFLDIHVIQRSLTVLNSAFDPTNISWINLGNDEVPQAFSWKVMLATGQECEPITEKTSKAYFTAVFLCIETAQESGLSLIIHSLCLICSIKLNRIITFTVLDKLIRVLC